MRALSERHRTLIRFALTIGVFVWLAYYVVDHWDLLVSLSRFDLGGIAVLGLLCTFLILINSALIHLAMGALGISTSLANMFSLNAVTMLLNYTPMRLGSIVRAIYLKRRYGLGLTRFAALFLHLNLLTLLVSTLAGLVALPAQFGVSSYQEQLLALVFLGCAAGAFLAIFSPLPVPAGAGKIASILRSLLEGRKLLAENRRTLAACVALLLLTIALAALRLGLVYAALSQSIHPLGVVILGAVGYVSMFVNITPGGLGVREVMLAGAAYALQIDFEIGLLAAVLDRAVWMATTFVVGGICTASMWSELRLLGAIGNAQPNSRTA